MAEPRIQPMASRSRRDVFRTGPHFSRLEAAIVLGLCVITAAAAVCFSNPVQAGLHHDDGIYISTAKSLAERGEYRLINLPSQPAATKYPPLYPAILATIWHVRPDFPANIRALKSVNALALSLTIGLTWLLSRRLRSWSPTIRIFAVLCLVTCPLTFSMSDLVMSELVFTVWVLAFMLCSPGKNEVWSLPYVAGAAFSAAAATLTRALGILLWPALAVGLFRRRDWRALALASGAFLLIDGPWFAWQAQHRLRDAGLLEYYVGYEASAFHWLITQPLFAARIFASNVAGYLSGSDLPLGISSPVLHAVVLACACVAFAAKRRGWPETTGPFVVLYVAAVCAHPFPAPRYFLPLLPFAYFAIADGAVELAREFSRFSRGSSGLFAQRILLLGPLLLVIVSHSFSISRFMKLPADAVHLGFLVPSSLSWQAFEGTVAWLKEHSDSSDRIAARHDPFYYLYTGLPGIRPWFSKPETYSDLYGRRWVDRPRPALIQSELDRLGVTLLIVDQAVPHPESDYASDQFARLLAEYHATWTLAYTTPDGHNQIYRRRPLKTVRR
jgi:hypothetical protein